MQIYSLWYILVWLKLFRPEIRKPSSFFLRKRHFTCFSIHFPLCNMGKLHLLTGYVNIKEEEQMWKWLVTFRVLCISADDVIDDKDASCRTHRANFAFCSMAEGDGTVLQVSDIHILGAKCMWSMSPWTEKGYQVRECMPTIGNSLGRSNYNDKTTMGKDRGDSSTDLLPFTAAGRKPTLTAATKSLWSFHSRARCSMVCCSVHWAIRWKGKHSFLYTGWLGS